MVDYLGRLLIGTSPTFFLGESIYVWCQHYLLNVCGIRRVVFPFFI